MSNNKQSSVDWLFRQVLELPLQLSNKRISQRSCELKILELFEQAKAMHKTEHFNTWWHGISENEPITFEQYYNETFGGSNEQR